MDNLSKCMIQCKKDGYGCHYGAWRAATGGLPVEEKNTLPKGWKKCEYCGEPFKPYNTQKYCGVHCQYKASQERVKRRKEAGTIELED